MLGYTVEKQMMLSINNCKHLNFPDDKLLINYFLETSSKIHEKKCSQNIPSTIFMKIAFLVY